MNPLGSFGAAAGGVSPELQDAMNRRGGGGGATAQVTQGAPGFDPATQPAQAPQGQVPPMPQMGGQAGMGQPTPQAPFDPAELKMITGALTGRLKLLGGIQEHISGKPPKVQGG